MVCNMPDIYHISTEIINLNPNSEFCAFCGVIAENCKRVFIGKSGDSMCQDCLVLVNDLMFNSDETTPTTAA